MLQWMKTKSKIPYQSIKLHWNHRGKLQGAMTYVGQTSQYDNGATNLTKGKGTYHRRNSWASWEYGVDTIVRHICEGENVRFIACWYEYKPAHDTVKSPEQISEHIVTWHWCRMERIGPVWQQQWQKWVIWSSKVPKELVLAECLQCQRRNSNDRHRLALIQYCTPK